MRLCEYPTTRITAILTPIEMHGQMIFPTPRCGSLKSFIRVSLSFLSSFCCGAHMNPRDSIEMNYIVSCLPFVLCYCYASDTAGGFVRIYPLRKIARFHGVSWKPFRESRFKLDSSRCLSIITEIIRYLHYPKPFASGDTQAPQAARHLPSTLLGTVRSADSANNWNLSCRSALPSRRNNMETFSLSRDLFSLFFRLIHCCSARRSTGRNCKEEHHSFRGVAKNYEQCHNRPPTPIDWWLRVARLRWKLLSPWLGASVTLSRFSVRVRCQG